MPRLKRSGGGHGYRRASRWARALAASAGVVFLGGCVSEETAGNPALHKFVWFRYLNGDDVRENCREGSPPYYRLVYNARYQEQIRRYEVIGDGAGGAYVVSRVKGRDGILANVTLNLDTILEQRWWQRSRTRVSPEAFARFEAALAESGFFEPAPEHLRLPSAGFYWIATGCRDGRIFFNAWRHPSERFDRLTFPEMLFAEDGNELPVNPPRPVDAAETTFKRGNPKFQQQTGIVFWLRVGDNGLAGY